MQQDASGLSRLFADCSKRARNALGVAQDFAQAAEDLKQLMGRCCWTSSISAAEAKKKLRAPAKQNALRLLRNYIVERWEMVDYPTALAHGWDIGSRPTEAMCKNMTLRLRCQNPWPHPNALETRSKR